MLRVRTPPLHTAQVIHEPLRTGFEVDKDFVPERDMIVAGRFQVIPCFAPASPLLRPTSSRNGHTQRLRAIHNHLFAPRKADGGVQHGLPCAARLVLTCFLPAVFSICSPVSGGRVPGRGGVQHGHPVQGPGVGERKGPRRKKRLRPARVSVDAFASRLLF